ncbi:MFS transporter [Acidiferrimicrobium sp. IK]|uniref:MFS transporter n=1 Tax=Acidiferrimicrobium sp. IK TaxID=2871700 RepID=UPI0021CB6C23|nr:MFS transporter [Acidiferrimicrobium sp. IK]MCU4186502.1 MFS transporter [Acidiferrimicrobium sp. IK]
MQVQTRCRCDPDAVAAIVAPRTGVVEEQPLAAPPGEYRFGQGEGPLAGYRREVVVTALPGGGYTVEQRVGLTVGLPLVAWLFALPLRRRLGRVGPEGPLPWWLPPARLSRRAAVVLVTLCAVSVLVGYLSDLLAYTMTYAASEFRVGSTGQGVALGVSRIAALGAVVVLVAADRRGRRPVLLAALFAGAAVTGASSLAPSLSSLTAMQVVAGAMAAAAGVLVGVLVVEEMPSGTRAWALGVSGMCFGLGSGLALAALPLAGTGAGGWRWLFALGLLVVPAAAAAARWLPESSRFVLAQAAEGRAGHADPGGAAPGRRRHRWAPHDRRVLVLLGAGAFLLALFADPGGALQNQYLRHQRHLSPLHISILLQVTGTVGGLGTLVGGRLADTRGRRPVAAVGVAALAGSTLGVYLTGGVALWWWEAASSVVSYGIGPALGVYGAELFPTGLRGRAGGVITVLGAAGGLVGLAAAGGLTSLIGTIGPALAVLSVGPAVLAVLVVVAYPETAARSLEELNPTDAPAAEVL